MSNETVREILMDVGKSAVGVAISKAIDLPSKLNIGNTQVMQHGSNGLLYTGISDVIDYASGGPSKLLNMNFRGLVDDSLYFTGLSFATEVAKLDSTFYRSIQNAGVSRDTAELVTEAAIISTGRLVMRYVDENPGAPDWMRLARYPTRALNL